MAYVIKGDRADQRLILAADQEKRERRTLGNGPPRPLNPIGEGLARQVISSPSWLPRRQKIVTVAALRYPKTKVTMSRLAKGHSLRFDDNFPFRFQH